MTSNDLQSTPSDADPLRKKRLTTGQAARELKLAPGTLQNWRSLGLGPKYMKIRRHVFYLMGDLIDFMNQEVEFYQSTQEWKIAQKQRRS